MAVTIDRTNYNALVDDDGTNTKGTPWSKNQVKIVLMDPIDGALAKVMPTTGGAGMVIGTGPVLQNASATVQFNISATNPLIIQSTDPAALANDKTWDIVAPNKSLTFRAVLDNYAGANAWMTVTRTTGNAGISALQFFSPSVQFVGGLLNASGFGSHIFAASGAGGLVLQIQNTGATATSKSEIALGTNANAALLDIVSYASTYTATVGFDQPNGSVLYQAGAGGLSFVAGAAGGTIRFYSGGVSERMRIGSTGEVLINAATNPNAGQVMVQVDGSTRPNGIVLYNAALTLMNFMAFIASAGGVAGLITQTAQNTVAYQTTSDARLKIDQGRATNLEALRAVVVHDFRWKADDRWDRGVFAQEAASVFPRAIGEGTDDLTDGGDLAHPWMTDYSKFVPDLIAGWQQHDAAIAQLRAALLALKG